MHRIIVDLPEPDGPQTTTLSPRPTTRLISFSTWNSPYHLWTACISIIEAGLGARAGIASAALLIDSPPRSLAAPALAERAFEHLAVARHEEAEAEIDRRGEDVGFGGEALPAGVGQRGVGGIQQVEQPDDQHERGVLEGADEIVDQRRDHHRQSLRQYDQPGAPPIAEAERVGRLDL